MGRLPRGQHTYNISPRPQQQSRNPQKPSNLPNWKTKTQAKPNLPPKKPKVATQKQKPSLNQESNQKRKAPRRKVATFTKAKVAT
ncbi:MAG: hypothetical protein ABSG33_05180 [Candidatus Bathyarchaeia archaeon]